MKKKHREKLLAYELTQLPEYTQTPFFEEEKQWYKIYKDGNHFVGTYCVHKGKQKHTEHIVTEEQQFFDAEYLTAMQQGIKKNKMFLYMKSLMLANYPNLQNIDKFVIDNIERKRHNFFSRLKRFTRKASMNLWNKWVTITYDSEKHTEESFRKKLRRCLSNLHTRRGWKYMGVFERAPETNRLHFHAIMYIPQGEMLGVIEEKQDYSTKQHKMQITHSNSFFAETFGRNDFVDLNENEIAYGRVIEYLTKYLHKTNERIVYSRGIPSEIYKQLGNEDIATEMLDFVMKFVLFDDVISTEKDIMHFKYNQMNFYDYYYNVS